MRLSFNLGKMKINLSSTGGVRVGGKIGETYISQRITKPSKASKKNTEEVGLNGI